MMAMVMMMMMMAVVMAVVMVVMMVMMMVMVMVMVVMVVLKRTAKKKVSHLDWECFLMLMVYHRGVFYIFLFDIFAHCALFVFVV
jgi:hypothetical protein